MEKGRNEPTHKAMGPQQLDHWTWVVGPKFSLHDRKAMNLSRHYSLQQVEYRRNFIFCRNFPIHKLYQRSCDLGLFRLTADRLSQMFGFRLHKRLPGKLATVQEKIDHGHHVLRPPGAAKSPVSRSTTPACFASWKSCSIMALNPGGWRSRQIHETILSAYQLSPQS